eukprot:2746898-Karenia_brevis.AAC.1
MASRIDTSNSGTDGGGGGHHQCQRQCFGANQLSDIDKKAVIQRFGHSPDIVVSESKLPSFVSSFLGLADGLSRPGCKYVYQVGLDIPGTADVSLQENATLSKSDRSSRVWSLDQQKHQVKARK